MGNRYSRQTRFAGFGADGQDRLGASHAALVGCGALGSCLAELLTRAGIGRLAIIDRDFVELSNLHRQSLYTEADAAESLPKAIAAKHRLAAINSEVEVIAQVADFNWRNARQLLDGAEILLDGTDNFEARLLLNDVAVATGRPWVQGSCVGAEGAAMVVRPGVTPCYRCLIEDLPGPGASPTCETAGVMGPVVLQVASWQAMEAMKLLSGRGEVATGMMAWDLWANRIRRVEVGSFGDYPECPCCKGRRFSYLEGAAGAREATLCGRNAVQLLPPEPQVLDLLALAPALGATKSSPHMLRIPDGPRTVSLFADGRAIVHGVGSIAEARGVYAKVVGS